MASVTEGVMDPSHVSPGVHVYTSSSGGGGAEERRANRQKGRVKACKYSSFYYPAKRLIVITFAHSLLGRSGVVFHAVVCFGVFLRDGFQVGMMML